MTEKIVKSLNISNRGLNKYTDPKGPLQTLFHQWLPIGQNLLDMIVDMLPSPLQISSEKVEHLICSNIRHFNSLPKDTQQLKNGIFQQAIFENLIF